MNSCSHSVMKFVTSHEQSYHGLWFARLISSPKVCASLPKLLTSSCMSNSLYAFRQMSSSNFQPSSYPLYLVNTASMWAKSRMFKEISKIQLYPLNIPFVFSWTVISYRKPDSAYFPFNTRKFLIAFTSQHTITNLQVYYCCRKVLHEIN